MDSENDYMMLDFDKGSVKGVLGTAENGNPNNRSTTASVVSTPDSHPDLANGFASSRRGSLQIDNVDDSLVVTTIKHLKNSSRNSSILAKTTTEQQLSSASSRKSQPPSEFESCDDLALNLQRPRPRPTHALPVATLPTGLCYDMRMRYHCEVEPPNHRVEYHPEDPRRIYHIYKELCLAGLVDDPLSKQPIVSKGLHRIFAREATQAEICLVHDLKHFISIHDTKDMNEDELSTVESQHDSIYFNRHTYMCALLSAGGAIDTCRAVAGRQLKNAIAVIRPPGHHAEFNRPMGFCIFDNVSISAKVCQKEFSETCKKILILDWDVHHGNGIQQAFYQDPSVLYISIHVHEDGEFYPHGPYGDHLHCGAGPGLGKNINIPWPTKGMGDADYLFAFQHVVLPVAYDFNPDLVIIAAGFDAAAGDQLGGCFVSPTCYAHMTSMLMPLANGKLVACLEGGYNLDSIAKSALAVTRTLMGEPPDRLQHVAASASGVATVRKVAAYQSRHWPCLMSRDMNQDLMRSLGAERMHDVVRLYQSAQLFEAHKMTPLWVHRDQVSKSFEKQVLATSNYTQAIPLLVIFHDPPEMMGMPDPLTQKLDLHNTWLADGLKYYIDWAVNQGFAVIDVNIPKHLTGIDGDVKEDRATRISLTHELTVYLWDNYIDSNDATEIFFMGVGTAYHGIMHLINRQETNFQRVTGVINFIFDETLLPVSDKETYWLSKWYKATSCVFVSVSHPVWSRLPGTKGPSKRFGNLVSSPAKGLNNMLVKHQSEVHSFVMGKLGDWKSSGRKTSVSSS